VAYRGVWRDTSPENRGLSPVFGPRFLVFYVDNVLDERGGGMSSEKERLEIARWVLERNLAWIAASEIKIGVIVAIDTALLGSLGAILGHAGIVSLSAWTCDE
jgi:hypothetical protein